MSEDNPASQSNPLPTRRKVPTQLNAELNGVAKHPLFNEVTRNLASLNEIFVEMLWAWANGERPNRELVQTVEEVLAQHNWNLGYEFQGRRPQRTDYVIYDERGSVPDAVRTDG